MPRRTATLEFYNALVEAFTRNPGNANVAAKEVQCNYRTARDAWEYGIQDVGAPIKDVVANIQAIVRGKLKEHDANTAEEREQLRVKIKAEAEKVAAEMQAEKAQLADEHYLIKMKEAELAAKLQVGQLLRDAKVDAAETIAKEVRLSRGARLCAERIYDLAEHIFTSSNVEKLAQFVISAMAGDLTPSEAAKFLQTLASFGKEANTVAKLALELERLRVGKPTEIVKVEVENLNEADALAIVEDAAAAAALLKNSDGEEQKPAVEELN